MDETIADSLGKQMDAYNQAFGGRLSPDDLQGQHLHQLVPADRAEQTKEIFSSPGFFDDLAVIEGSREVIRQLAERYEVFVASAAMEVPTSFAAKYSWLRTHFPFIPTSHIVFCGDKSVIAADYLIDDEPRHFARFGGEGILFTAPQNRLVTGYRRVDTWADVRRLFLAGG